MKAHAITAGLILVLLTFARLWRIAFENRQLATEPGLPLHTLLSAALAVWSLRVLRQIGR
jgi:hypothetical protein